MTKQNWFMLLAGANLGFILGLLFAEGTRFLCRPPAPSLLQAEPSLADQWGGYSGFKKQWKVWEKEYNGESWVCGSPIPPEFSDRMWREKESGEWDRED